MVESFRIGNSYVAIYVPSRYADGELIPDKNRGNAVSAIRAGFSSIFGGATSIQEAEGMGSYAQGGGCLAGHIVDERITRVYASVDEQDCLLGPKSQQYRDSVFVVAAGIGTDLQQETMGVEWGNEFHLVYASGRTRISKLPFSKYGKPTQFQAVVASLLRLNGMEDFRLLLSLNNWTGVASEKGGSAPELRQIAGKGARKAFIYGPRLQEGRISAAERKRIVRETEDNDLVFAMDSDTEFVILLNRSGTLVGSRPIPARLPDGTIPRITSTFALALLESTLAPSLSQVIDRGEVTGLFFKAYREMHGRLADAILQQGIPEEAADKEAQLLLGRLMFLRFIEQKEWLDNNPQYLADLYRTHEQGNYYDKALKPLFYGQLDVPPAERKTKAGRGIPYINGGLFRKGECDYTLHNGFFDPDIKGSIFNLFDRYDFTLDEATGIGQHVAINPSIFGSVLEGMCSDRERKKHGVHYTPPIIGHTLARKAIVSRLSELSNVEEPRLRKFAFGDQSALTHEEAEHVRGCLTNIRIVDPAVGSGSLLLAALEELMHLQAACGKKLEQPLVRGGHTWAKNMRHFVQHCLYGVDIDSHAVEVAKLRLWLAIAVGDNAPTPLPDLEYNIRVGDSLSEIMKPEEMRQQELGLDTLSTARNEFMNALHEYRRAAGSSIRNTAQILQQKERAYICQYLESQSTPESRRLAKDLSQGRPLPFLWHLHFSEVFQSACGGFDVVIANPPYVRAQNLALEEKSVITDYMDRFKSMTSGAKDLYLAFVEQGLRLAGTAGKIAYIMPTFARTQSGEELRDILAKKGSVDLWVDFGDIQVFATADNYVALLFGRAGGTRKKTFECKKANSEIWPASEREDWLADISVAKVPYKCDIWRTMAAADVPFISAVEKGALRLGEIADIGVGVQTSADDVYLLTILEGGGKLTARVYSDFLKCEVEIERRLLKSCAKGSKHLKPYLHDDVVCMLWPYDAEGKPLSESALSGKYPKCWTYLKECKERLMARAMSASKENGDCWWRFGREQGISLCGSPKVLVPSTMHGATAMHDREGRIAFTASGKGGGGAWALVPKKEGEDPGWLVALLNSDIVWHWLQIEGDPKKGGWRGVDKAVLARIPVPKLSAQQKRQLAALAEAAHRSVLDDEDPSAHTASINKIIQKAFGSPSIG